LSQVTGNDSLSSDSAGFFSIDICCTVQDFLGKIASDHAFSGKSAGLFVQNVLSKTSLNAFCTVLFNQNSRVSVCLNSGLAGCRVITGVASFGDIAGIEHDNASLSVDGIDCTRGDLDVSRAAPAVAFGGINRDVDFASLARDRKCCEISKFEHVVDVAWKLGGRNESSAIQSRKTAGHAVVVFDSLHATFESGHVRPLALSPDGTQLFAVNTPDNRLEIFDLDGNGKLVRAGVVPVGMEPVAVAARNNREVWVVNKLSDSVSIVDTSSLQARVIRTLLIGDEPQDIVFAGPNGNRAFITAANRNLPRFQPTDERNADVWVFDAENLGGGAGQPLAVINLFSDVPRALAVSPDGNTVYAAPFMSGNETTIAGGNKVNGDGCNEFCTLSTYARCDVDSDCKGTEDNPVQSCKEPAAGQNKTYCLPSDKEKDERKDQDKYRTICMEYDYCWPPEERADWLGKKEEDQ